MVSKKGFDVSHHNGELDFVKAKAEGNEFVIVKATEGATFVDPMFAANVKNAKVAGLHVGAYVFIDSGVDFMTQMNHFWAVVEPHITDLTYPLVIDLEENKNKLSADVLTAELIKGLEFIEGKGQFGMWYTYTDFLNTQLEASKLTPYASWLAHYAQELGTTAGIWQYNDKGVVAGTTNVDLDVSYVDYASEIIGMREKKTEVKVEEKPTPSPKPTAVKPKIIDTNSLVDWLKAHHHPFDFVSRVKLAVKMGIHNYNGSADQNSGLLDKLENQTTPVVSHYTVQSGDKLSEIAASHHTTTEELQKLNKIEDPDKIYIGQVIILK